MQKKQLLSYLLPVHVSNNGHTPLNFAGLTKTKPLLLKGTKDKRLKKSKLLGVSIKQKNKFCFYKFLYNFGN